MKRSWAIIALFILILALVPISSATADQFNVTVCPSVPYYVGVVYSTPVYLTAYSFNSSINISYDNWSIYGSNDGITFYQFENQSNVNFTANVSQTYNLSCGYVYFRYYIIRFEGGFAGCPDITIIFYTQLYPPSPLSGGSVDTSKLYSNSILVVASCGSLYLAIIVGVLWKKRKRKKKHTGSEP